MQPIRVLVVDDHPLFRRGLRDALSGEADIEVVGEAVDGRQALDQARALSPDAILLDINLPQLNGLQVLKQLRAEDSPSAVVILTAYDDVEQERWAFRGGCAAYCPKDISRDKLLNVLRKVQQGFFVVGELVFDQSGLDTWLQAGARGAPASEEDAFALLSPREMEILQYVTSGLSNKEIASRLGISHQTVKNHMTAILQKLHVDDRTQAAVYALRHGWVDLQEGKRSKPS